MSEEDKGFLTAGVVMDVGLDSLVIEEAYQRKVSLYKAAKIAKKFNAAAFGMPAVNIRSDGAFVIDGWHRVTALRLRAEAGTIEANSMVKCEVWDGLTLEEEAQVFLDRNETKAVNRADEFRARVVAGDGTALAIEALLAEFGLRIGGTRQKNVVMAVAAVESAYDMSPYALQLALGAATSAWPDHTRVTQSAVILGLTLFFIKNKNAVKMDELVARLKQETDPDRLLGQASGQADTLRCSKNVAVARVVTAIYNWRRTSPASRLDEFPVAPSPRS